MSSKLLSICIPTYNRCETLKNTLTELFSNPDFNENLIEVIVSDNCSTDNTKQVVSKFNLVKYYRNETNIKDENFSKVLSYATGKYIRLFNDTLIFKPNELKFILDVIKDNSSEQKTLLFYKNQFNNSQCVKTFKKKSELINELSFLTTWIANFGIWNNDFAKIINKDRFSSLQLSQVDWTYQLVKNKKEIKVYFRDFFDVSDVNKKGGYNVFDVFIHNYLFIIKNQGFSIYLYEKEKYRLFRYFVYSWMFLLLMKTNDNFSFDNSKPFRIIFIKYWYEPYFYAFIGLFFLKKIVSKMRE